MMRGNDMPTMSWLSPREETEDTMRAAHVDSAKEPKRSAPMPAMSPTLSPTLSAEGAIGDCGWEGGVGASVGCKQGGKL